MEIRFPKNYCYNYIQPKKQSTEKQELRNTGYSSIPQYCPEYFSPSFTAMKKNEFKGTDRLVVEKFKAPIQTFRTPDDFTNWANERCDEILKKDYTARSKEATIQRKAALKEWQDYLYNDNDAYTPAHKLLILDGITKDLGKNDDNIPPILNRGVLANTIDSLNRELKTNQNKKEYNFSKTYQNNLRLHALSDTEDATGTSKTGWIRIPSKENDPKNFDENVERLKTLSHKNWCTKTFNAKPYLKQGDFHVYLENGKPKLGIRFIGDEIEEIQGERNNKKIPYSYYDECVSYINKNNFTLSNRAKKEVRQGEVTKNKYSALRNTIINAKNEEVIFNAIGIKTKKDKDNLLILSHFRKIGDMESDGISYDDLGVNLDKLFKKVKEIKNYADFEDLTIQSLPNLTKISGNANFNNAKIGSINKLESITENADFSYSNIKDLSALKEIGGKANFYRATIEDLGALEAIHGNACFEYAEIENLSNLSYIGGRVTSKGSKITNMHTIPSQSSDESQENKSSKNKIKSLKKEKIRETIDRMDNISKKKYKSKIKASKNERSKKVSNPLKEISMQKYRSLMKACKNGNPERFFKELHIDYKMNYDGTYTISHFAPTHEMKTDKITFKDLGINLDKIMKNVSEIEKNANFRDTKITALPNLKKIGGHANFSGTEIKDLHNLTTIGKNANFNYTRDNNIDLSSLKTIGGMGSFQTTSIKNMSNLTEIGGDAWFQEIYVKGGLPKLKKIGRDATIYRANIENLDSLETIGRNIDFENVDIEELPNLVSVGSNATFKESGIKRLPKLKKIGGTANFKEVEMDDLGCLEEIGHDAYFELAKVKNLSSLTVIGGENADFEKSKIDDLSSLTTIKGNANFKYAKIKSIPKLTEIGGDAEFFEAGIEELPELTTIGKNADFSQSKVKNLNKLKTIKGDGYFSNVEIENLPSLETIGQYGNFSWCKIGNLGKLKSIGKGASFYQSKIKDLSGLERIERSADFYNAKIGNMANLRYIGGKVCLTHAEIKNQTHEYIKNISMQKFQPLVKACKTGNPEEIFKAMGIDCRTNEDGTYTISHFDRTEEMKKCDLKDKDIGTNLDKLMENVSEIEGDADFFHWIYDKCINLPKLKRIGGNVDFACKKIENMSELTEIGGNVDFTFAEAKNLSKLTKIGGDADFCQANIEDLSGLKEIGGDAKFTQVKIGDLSSLDRVGGSISSWDARIDKKSDYIKSKIKDDDP